MAKQKVQRLTNSNIQPQREKITAPPHKQAVSSVDISPGLPAFTVDECLIGGFKAV